MGSWDVLNTHLGTLRSTEMNHECLTPAFQKCGLGTATDRLTPGKKEHHLYSLRMCMYL